MLLFFALVDGKLLAGLIGKVDLAVFGVGAGRKCPHHLLEIGDVDVVFDQQDFWHVEGGFTGECGFADALRELVRGDAQLLVPVRADRDDEPMRCGLEGEPDRGHRKTGLAKLIKKFCSEHGADRRVILLDGGTGGNALVFVVPESKRCAVR